MGRSQGRRLRGALLAGAAVVLGGTTLAACGGSSGPPTLTWYINPDDGGQAEIANRCTAAANGAYRITTSLLPNDATAQREQLIRRLAAEDSSIDLMSLDPPFLPEFAEAGFLRPFTAEEAAQFTEGVVEGAVKGAQWDNQLYGAPFWANTQLLWYRKSVADKAGLDPQAGPVTWDQIIQAASDNGATVAVQANRYEGYTVWINALVSSAGGAIIENPGAPVDEMQLGLETEAGRRATEIIGQVANSPAAGPSISTEAEEASRALFNSPQGGFMVNWPYVWRASNAAVEAGSLSQDVIDDYAWTRYPQANAGEESAPPLGGINVSIGAFSNNQDFALEAVKCIVSKENQTYYFISNGNPAALESVFDDPEVLKVFPMAALIRESLIAASPRPQTPYYGEVSASLQRTFHPPTGVNPETTPERATQLITDVLNKEVLL